MTGLDWIPLYEAFGKFEARARKQGLFSKDLDRIEDELCRLCPFPQITGVKNDMKKAEKQP